MSLANKCSSNQAREYTCSPMIPNSRPHLAMNHLQKGPCKYFMALMIKLFFPMSLKATWRACSSSSTASRPSPFLKTAAASFTLAWTALSNWGRIFPERKIESRVVKTVDQPRGNSNHQCGDHGINCLAMLQGQELCHTSPYAVMPDLALRNL